MPPKSKTTSQPAILFFPMVIAGVVVTGLIGALFTDGSADNLFCVLLALPLVTIIWAIARRPDKERTLDRC